jgi:hypothetical protein
MTCCCNAQKAVAEYRQRVGGGVLLACAFCFVLGACSATLWRDAPTCPAPSTPLDPG